MAGSIVARNSAGIQEHLFQQLDGLDDGTITPQHARAVSSVVGQIIASARLEIDYARFVTERRSDEGGLRALPMGNADRAIQ